MAMHSLLKSTQVKNFIYNLKIPEIENNKHRTKMNQSTEKQQRESRKPRHFKTLARLTKGKITEIYFI